MLQGGAEDLIRTVWVSFPLCGQSELCVAKFLFVIFCWSVS
jgi:hypothetical protein